MNMTPGMGSREGSSEGWQRIQPARDRSGFPFGISATTVQAFCVKWKPDGPF